MNKTPSLFWPLQWLVTVLVLWFLYQVVGLTSQRQATLQQLGQLVPTYRTAVQIIQQREALAQDLLTTSAQDSGAAQIVKEFQIQSKTADRGIEKSASDKEPKK